MTPRKAIECGIAERIDRRDKVILFHQDLLSPLGMWTENEKGIKMAVYPRAVIRPGH